MFWNRFVFKRKGKHEIKRKRFYSLPHCSWARPSQHSGPRPSLLPPHGLLPSSPSLLSFPRGLDSRPTLDWPASRALHLAAAVDERVPRPWDTDRWGPAVRVVPYLVFELDTSSSRNHRARFRASNPGSARFSPFIYSPRPSPNSPTPSLSAILSPSQAAAPPRSTPSSILRCVVFLHRKRLAELRFSLTKSPRPFVPDFVLSVHGLISPNCAGARRPPSAIAGTLWSISTLLLALGKFALSSTMS